MKGFLVPGNIDWAQLARQKRWLLQHARTSEEAGGLLSFLDAIQDAAVDMARVPEEVVFRNLAEFETEEQSDASSP